MFAAHLSAPEPFYVWVGGLETQLIAFVKNLFLTVLVNRLL